MVGVGGSFKSRPQSHTERVLRLDLYPGPERRSHAHRQDDRSVSPRDSAPVMPELFARQKMEARNNEDGLRLRNSALSFAPFVNRYILVNVAICSIKDCASPARTRGWCTMHYQRWQHHRDPLYAKQARGRPATQRFWEKVDVGDADECWWWRGGRGSNG